MRTALALAVAFVLVLFSGAAALEVPKGAALIDVSPLPCSGVLATFDTDGDPANGAEFMAVVRSGDSAPLVVIEFAPGADGAFRRAVVALPDREPQVFGSAAALSAVYPHPCDAISRAGQRT